MYNLKTRWEQCMILMENTLNKLYTYVIEDNGPLTFKIRHFDCTNPIILIVVII